MRERLIELLKSKSCRENLCMGKNCADCEYIAIFEGDVEKIADCLLDNGVVVPTIAIDDTVYRIGQDDRIYEWQIAYIHAYKDEIVYIDDSDNYIFESDIGKTVFFNREDAEAKLKGKTK